jgi:hypothetical protein
MRKKQLLENPYYKAGYDAGKNGADTTNCNFRNFDTIEHKELWEKGNIEGLKTKRVLEEISEEISNN